MENEIISHGEKIEEHLKKPGMLFGGLSGTKLRRVVIVPSGWGLMDCVADLSGIKCLFPSGWDSVKFSFSFYICNALTNMCVNPLWIN